MKLSNYDPVEFKFLAERARNRGDYETAARFFRYLMVHFGVVNDEANRRRFAVKAGECYMRAAENLEGSVKARMLCLKAAEAFKEGGSMEMVNLCGSLVWRYYTALRGSDFENYGESLHILKSAGDYFMGNSDFKRAASIYLDAAERAFESGRLLLAGGLYRDAAVCYQKIRELDESANLHVKAADLYFQLQEYFEAAWIYCKAGFLLIRLGRFEEALAIAKKAELACREERMEFFLTDLSRVCELLSQGLKDEAREKWNKIRRKLNKNYIQLVESSFQAVNFSVKKDS